MTELASSTNRNRHVHLGAMVKALCNIVSGVGGMPVKVVASSIEAVRKRVLAKHRGLP